MSCPATISNKSVADFCNWQGAATSHSGAMASAVASSHNAAKLGVTKYGIKIVISLIDTPFIYWARYIHRSRRETAAQPA